MRATLSNKMTKPRSHKGARLLRRLVPMLILWAACASTLGARADVAPEGGDSRIIWSTSFKSMALGQQLRHSIYLPPNFDASGATRYPVIYLLHGYGGDDTSWLKSGDLQGAADRLIREGTLPPAIIVMPFASTGWYVDSEGREGTGRWQTAILNDLITFIDARYPTSTDGSQRAIGGLSMGGYGALRLALMEPDEFAAAASLSGALFSDVKNATDFPAFQLRLFGRSFGKTFDPVTFNENSPWRSLDDDEELGEAPALFMVWGDRDIPILAAGNVKFVDALKTAGIPVTSGVAPGGHDWGLWTPQTPRMLSFLGQRLKRGKTVSQAAPVANATRVAAEVATPGSFAQGVKGAAPVPTAPGALAPAIPQIAAPKPAPRP